MLQEATAAKELAGALLLLWYPSHKGLVPNTVTKHLQRVI